MMARIPDKIQLQRRISVSLTETYLRTSSSFSMITSVALTLCPSRSQVTDLQAKRAKMQKQCFGSFLPRKRQLEVKSESDNTSIKRKGSTQEPRVSETRLPQ
jgi:hypothetical protein